MRFFTRLFLLFVCLLAGAALQAQPGRDPFGKSRIQYKNFDWKLYNTQNFNLYFYKGGEQTAKDAADYAERELKRITSLIGYYPYSKITLVLYNSATDLRQSNIGLYSDQFQTGGETLFMKNKLQLAYEGTKTDFKRKLSYELTELLLNDMMYGGSLKEALQSSYLLRLPEWFVGGVAAYTAEGWSVRMDSHIRDLMLDADKLRAEQTLMRYPELTGQSVWNYIAERYGYTSIQNILNLTRITRDVEIGITSSLNIPYKRFLQDWLNYYQQINARPEDPFVSLPDDKKVFDKNKRALRYTEPVLNSNGTLLAYAENDNGNYKIIVKDVKGKSSRVVWRGGYKTLDQPSDYSLPVLAWRTNTQLGFIEPRRGKMLLRQVNAKNKSSFLPFYDDLTKPAATLGNFSQVRDMSYSEDGSQIVISAVENGQTDLYLLQSNGRIVGQLTNDVYDDIQPVFLKGSKNIVFSSNRWVDSSGTVQAATFKDVVDNYDVFLLQQTAPVSITQLTSGIASELRPRATADGNFMFLSEENGIRSLYTYNLTTGTKIPVSNFVQNIEAYDYVGSNNTLALVAKDYARDFVYLLPDYTSVAQDTLPKTARQIILETRARVPQAAATTRKLLEVEANKEEDTTRTEGEVNIENYEFGSEPEKVKVKTDTIAVTDTTTKAVEQVAAKPKANTAPEFKLVGPLEYDTRFSVHEIITSVYADPQLGFGIVAGVNMSDLFENHHIRGTAYLRTDLETSRMFAEYVNLKNRVDLGVQYRRDIIVSSVLEAPGAIVRFARNEVAPLLVYPLSYSTSLRAQPRFVTTRFTQVNDFSSPDSVNNMYGGNVEMVFDNSVVTGVNMMEGTRMKVGFLSLRDFESSRANFNKFYVDLRHYQKIHREIILAARLSYGAFFGKSPKNYLIGGMDNWLFAGEDDETERNDVNIQSAPDLFYLEYALPLRGYDYNTRTGSKHLLANAELRIPIIQYLYNGAIGSGFFRNLQLTAFADAGSAYNGSNPFTGNNSINTRIVGGRTDATNNNPFEITVINYRNPFLVGYGFGARSTLFGVYGKLDVAWSEDDMGSRGPKLYVTLGYDF
ncbi:hypothetical protein H8S95_16430 [Pontibacter sp. KCTC 32443]|uniref:hypothetical protein n=1 Tax=Pontibacter TaxID=323449 RepID=UPI00164EC614|nr:MULTISPECIES: hypothetical protein [Pontibacter]MBC5775666.1 hypothetical protein [Pontibacter sp. KCTC 32443]